MVLLGMPNQLFLYVGSAEPSIHVGLKPLMEERLRATNAPCTFGPDFHENFPIGLELDPNYELAPKSLKFFGKSYVKPSLVETL